MEQWQKFLDSLASPGGGIFILVIIGFILTVSMLYVALHSDRYGQLTSTLLSHILSGFTGALLRDLTRSH